MKKRKFVSFGAGDLWHLIKRMKKENEDYPFSRDIIFKQNSINVFLDGICIVNLENWPPPPPPPPPLALPQTQVEQAAKQERVETMSIFYKFRSRRSELLCKNSCSKNFGRFSEKHPWWGPVFKKLRKEGL